MTEHDDMPQVGRQGDRLAKLRPARDPERDLWPGIAVRLEPRRVVRRPALASTAAGWLPVGAALAAGYLIATLFPLPRAPGRELGVPASGTPLPFAIVEPALAQLSPKARAVVEVDLSGLEHDRLSIEQALAADPDNPLLNELRSSTEMRLISLVEQVNRLTQPMDDEAFEL